MMFFNMLAKFAPECLTGDEDVDIQLELLCHAGMCCYLNLILDGAHDQINTNSDYEKTLMFNPIFTEKGFEENVQATIEVSQALADYTAQILVDAEVVEEDLNEPEED